MNKEPILHKNRVEKREHEPTFNPFPEGSAELSRIISKTEQVIGDEVTYHLSKGTDYSRLIITRNDPDRTINLDELEEYFSLLGTNPEDLDYCTQHLADNDGYMPQTILFLKLQPETPELVVIKMFEINELYKNKGIGTHFYTNLERSLSNRGFRFILGNQDGLPELEFFLRNRRLLGSIKPEKREPFLKYALKDTYTTVKFLRHSDTFEYVVENDLMLTVDEILSSTDRLQEERKLGH